MKTRSLSFPVAPLTCPVTPPTWTRPWLALALALTALAAGAGCDAKGTFNITDLRAGHMGIGVGAARPGESTREIAVSVGLPLPSRGECHHEIPGDLDFTVNDRGPTSLGLTTSNDGHSFTLGCTANDRYGLEGDFLVPTAAEVLTVKLEKDGDQLAVRVTLPPDPPVAVALGATELGQDSPIAVELRTTPNVLSIDATCWIASVVSRASNASSNLSVSSAAIDGGVRLQLALPADAPPLPSGPATLTILAREEERCSLPASCEGIPSCSVHRDLNRDLGPFDVRIR